MILGKERNNHNFWGYEREGGGKYSGCLSRGGEDYLLFGDL